MFADITGFNVVVNPGTAGLVSAQFDDVPWDHALREVLAPSRHLAQRVENVLWIGRPEQASPRPTFSGRPIDVDFLSVDARAGLASPGASALSWLRGITRLPGLDEPRVKPC